MTKSLVRVPNIPLATVYQRTARDGSTYLVGRLANAKIMIIETDRSSRGDKVWEIVIAPGAHDVPNTAGLNGFDARGGDSG